MRDSKRTRVVAPAPRARSYTAVKAEWEAIIVAWARPLLSMPPMPRVAVVFCWSEPDTKRDPDGISSGGSKLMFDGLVKAGVLSGDRWTNVASIVHEFSFGAVAPGVRVVFKWYEAMGRGAMVYDVGFFPHRLPDLNELLALRESSARRSVKSSLRGRIV